MQAERRFTPFLQLDSEIRRLILLECSWVMLCRYSRTSKEARKEMKDDMFWELKTKKDFGTPDKPPFKGFPDSKFSLKYWCKYNQKSENPKSWKFIYTECRRRLGDELIDCMKKRRYNRILFLLRVGADPYAYSWLRSKMMRWASKRGQPAIVLELLKNEVDVDKRDQDGRMALMAASKKGRFVVVNLLLKNGVDPNIKDYRDNTPLMEAVEGGYFGTVDLLLKAGADPNVKDGWCETALIKAITEGHSAVVDSLLEANADPNVNDRHCEIALIKASRYGRITIVDSLLEANTDPNIKNVFGQTALEVAYDRKHENVVRTLLESGAEKARPKFYHKLVRYIKVCWMVIKAMKAIGEYLPGSRRFSWSEVLACVMIVVLFEVMRFYMWYPEDGEN